MGNGIDHLLCFRMSFTINTAPNYEGIFPQGDGEFKLLGRNVRDEERDREREKHGESNKQLP